MDLKIKNCTMGHIKEEQPFALVAVVKEGMSALFETQTNIANGNQKSFILCACKTKDKPYDTIFYFSNDPNDFIPNYTYSARNLGFIPCKKKEDTLWFDILNLNNSRTISMPPEAKTNLADYNNQILHLQWKDIDSDLLVDSQRLYNGIPYEMKFGDYYDDDRINFYVRKNVTAANNGRIGPSIALFSQPSDIFEYQKTSSFSEYGVSFIFDSSKKNEFGISKLTLDTNSATYSDLPVNNDCGIMELKQGTSIWYNTFNNHSGISNVYLNIDNTNTFLNTTVFNPDVTKGISVKVNLRNTESNFIDVKSITGAGVSEVFDYYFVNTGDFISGGIENDSSQYFDQTSSDILKGGVCYYLNKNYTYYGFFNNENTKGFIGAINCLNGTSVNKSNVDSSKLTSFHAGANASFSTYNESLFGINTNSFIANDPKSTSGRTNNTSSNSKNVPVLKNDAHKNLTNPNKAIFTDKPLDGQNNFYIEIGIMSALIVIFILFTIYYYRLKLNSEEKKKDKK